MIKTAFYTIMASLPFFILAGWGAMVMQSLESSW